MDCSFYCRALLVCTVLGCITLISVERGTLFWIEIDGSSPSVRFIDKRLYSPFVAHTVYCVSLRTWYDVYYFCSYEFGLWNLKQWYLTTTSSRCVSFECKQKNSTDNLVKVVFTIRLSNMRVWLDNIIMRILTWYLGRTRGWLLVFL